MELAAPRVLQDDELNQIVNAECRGRGGGVIRNQTSGLEVSDSILA
jgi:hypothetical protein